MGLPYALAGKLLMAGILPISPMDRWVGHHVIGEDFAAGGVPLALSVHGQCAYKGPLLLPE